MFLLNDRLLNQAKLWKTRTVFTQFLITFKVHPKFKV